AGIPEQAEESLRRALALYDEVPETWVALVQHLMRMDNKTEAENVTRQAEKKLGQGNTRRDLGQCYELCGDTGRAKELYHAVLIAHPQDTKVLFDLAGLSRRLKRPADAKRYLHSIMDLKTSSAADAATARRELAIVIAVEGGYLNLEDALAV